MTLNFECQILIRNFIYSTYILWSYLAKTERFSFKNLNSYKFKVKFINIIYWTLRRAFPAEEGFKTRGIWCCSQIGHKLNIFSEKSHLEQTSWCVRKVCTQENFKNFKILHAIGRFLQAFWRKMKTPYFLKRNV